MQATIRQVGYSIAVPSPLRRRAVRLLSRWQAVRRTGPRLPVVAVVTAFAMVGALVLDSGIAARTPDGTPSSATSHASLSVPGTQFKRVDRVVALEDPDPYVLGPTPGTIASLDVQLDALLRTSASDPMALLEWTSRSAALLDWMNRSLAVAQQIAAQTARASALDSYALDAVRLGPPAVGAAASRSRAPRHKAPRHQAPRHHAPRHHAPKPAPRPTRAPNPPARRSSGPDGIWNVAPIVTWYGPGFYGNRTACGERYTTTIIGVAHRTLPCGTLIQFRWHGITAVAPVIDRGPYASSAYVFDWSAALACHVFKPRGVSNSCFTRHDVQWRIVGRRRH
jgi:hypothetical protein